MFLAMFRGADKQVLNVIVRSSEPEIRVRREEGLVASLRQLTHWRDDVLSTLAESLLRKWELTRCCRSTTCGI